MRIDPHGLLRTLDELTAPELAEEEIGPSIGRTVARAAELIGVTGVGLMLIDPADQQLRFVAATDGLAQELEAAHEAVGEGPCVEAYVLGEVVATRDVRSDARWPALRDALEGAGIGAVLGMPTCLSSEPIGSLNAYASGPHDWDESEVRALRAFNDLLEARLASAAWARRHERVSELAGQLQHALDQRVVIERGIGFLMGRRNLSAVAAFHLLRSTARRERRKVASVAVDLLDGVDLDEIASDVGSGAPISTPESASE